jgi:hypothetical protein
LDLYSANRVSREYFAKVLPGGLLGQHDRLQIEPMEIHGSSRMSPISALVAVSPGFVQGNSRTGSSSSSTISLLREEIDAS